MKGSYYIWWLIFGIFTHCFHLSLFFIARDRFDREFELSFVNVSVLNQGLASSSSQQLISNHHHHQYMIGDYMLPSAASLLQQQSVGGASSVMQQQARTILPTASLLPSAMVNNLGGATNVLHYKTVGEL